MRRSRRILPRWIVRIGDASYSLYLSHLFTIDVIGHVLARLARRAPWLSTPAAHAAALGIAVIAALFVAELSYRWIEGPLLRAHGR